MKMISSSLYLFNGKVTFSDLMNMPVHFAFDLVDEFVRIENELRKQLEQGQERLATLPSQM